MAALLALALVAGGAALWLTLREPAPPTDQADTWVAITIAGDGTAGSRDGETARARFSEPFGIAAADDGTLFVTDAGRSHRIRRVAPDGYVTTLAGGDPGFADGHGMAARFSTPSMLAMDAAGTLYVADTGNNAIRRVTLDGAVTTVAGDGTAGFRDGPGQQARFNAPVGVAVDAAGRILVADTYNDRIRVIQADGTVATLAGAGLAGYEDGPAGIARFDTPTGIAVNGTDRIYIADTGNDVIRLLDPATGVSTIAASRTTGLLRPIGVAAGPEGDVYLTDERGRIIALSQDQDEIAAIAGSRPGFRDDDGPGALFRRPAGVVWMAPGRLAIADAGNALVRVLATRSTFEHRPPPSPRLAPRFDPERAGFDWRPLFWPVAPLVGLHEIAGTFGEARGELAERFHSGVDVRSDRGTPVRAVRDGIVQSPVSTGAFGTLNEWLRIGPVTYVHLQAGRGRRNDDLLDSARFAPVFDAGGTLVRMRVKRGAQFATGEEIGSVNAFNHVHLNVGWPGEEHNPLNFGLVRFEDTVPPTIPAGGVRLYDDQGQRFAERAGGRLVVSGRVRVVAEAWDQVDGNRPGRRLGLYALGYQVLRRDGSPAAGFEEVRWTIAFDRLASEADAARLVYAPGSGIPFYRRGATRFRYIVTNTLQGGVASEGAWDTTTLPPGDYIVRIHATDIRGNTAEANRDVAVKVVSNQPG